MLHGNPDTGAWMRSDAIERQAARDNWMRSAAAEGKLRSVDDVGYPGTFESHAAALEAAGRRILKDRRRMSIEDAEDIIRMEFTRRGMNVSPQYVRVRARHFHRGLAWPFLHPIKARREGYRHRFGWRD